ncbi:MAG TPA: hypothetical protein VGM23_02865 [Armatimonadota bacterium]
MQQIAARNYRVSPWGMLTLVLCGLCGGLLSGCGGGGDPPPSSRSVVGQLLEGAGSANYFGLSNPATMMDIGFRSPKSGVVTQMTLQWKTSEGYGAGNGGTFAFMLRENGAGNFGTGAIVAMATNITPATAMDGRADGILHFPIDATLTAGTRYHLVIQNMDAQAAANWSSPNTLQTRLVPWDGTGNRVAQFQDGRWSPWASTESPYNTTGSNDANGSYCPIMITWDDGTNTGEPYYTTNYRYIAAERVVGERLYWSYPTTTIHRVGFVVWKNGNPADLRYTLENLDAGTTLASGVLAQAGDVGDVGTWVYADLPTPVTLTQGTNYRLYMSSPDSVSTDNSYGTYMLFSDAIFPIWEANTWGGEESCACYISTHDEWEYDGNIDVTFSVE